MTKDGRQRDDEFGSGKAEIGKRGALIGKIQHRVSRINPSTIST